MFELGCDNIFEDGVAVGDRIYYAAWNRNGVFSMDGEDYTVRFHGTFPECHEEAARLFGCVCHNGKSLFFGPHNAGYFAEYDLRAEIIRKVPCPFIEKGQKPKFQIAFSYKECVFFIGASVPYILSYDTNNGAWKKIDGWESKLEAGKVRNGYFFQKGFFLSGGTAYLASSQSNYLLKLHLDEQRGELIRLGNEKYCYSDLCNDGSSLWLAPMMLQQPLVRWDLLTGEQSEIHVRLERPLEKVVPLSGFGWRICCVDGAILLFPVSPGCDTDSGYVLKYDVDQDRLYSLNMPGVEEKVHGLSSWLQFRQGKEVWFCNVKTQKLYTVHPAIDSIKEKNIVWERDSLIRWEAERLRKISDRGGNNGLLLEIDDFSLPVLINTSVGMAQRTDERNANIGRRIWDAAKRKV